MRPYPGEAIPENGLRALRLLASDIDDTLTDENGRIPPEALELIARLRTTPGENASEPPLQVWLVTGRCASWAQALSRYLPLDGAIAENGGAICRGENLRLLADPAALGPNRERLAAAFARIRERIPRAETTPDNIGRVTDWTFDRKPLSDGDIALATDLAAELGLRVVTSSIHVHLFAGDYDKATAVGAVCDELGVIDREQALTLGDSPNDESLFDPVRFPFSAGVANVMPNLSRMTHAPRFVLPHARVEGAMWLMRRILVCRGR
jgi:HAD superfamily hydrolase (TIGR01484 family)